MDPFTFTLALGAVGLLVMGVSGLGHRLHPGSHSVGHGHHGHGHAAAKTGGRGPAAPHAHGMQVGVARVSRAFLTLVSPRVAFSLLLGFGATGFLLHGVLGGPLLAAVAVAGAACFEGLLVRPFFNLLSRFASEPALTLESTVGDEVQVVSGFDAEGHGLVAVELDGQIVQLLGTLASEDRTGPRVRAGEKLYVQDVDSGRHRMVVGRRQV